MQARRRETISLGDLSARLAGGEATIDLSTFDVLACRTFPRHWTSLQLDTTCVCVRAFSDLLVGSGEAQDEVRYSPAIAEESFNSL